MKKYLIIILIIALAILLSVIGFIIYRSRVTAKTTVEINGFRFLTTIADTTASREQGLSGKDSMSNGEAMLFIFTNQAIRTFWMKDMKFNLDILFIRDNKIVEIVTLQKPSGDKIPEHTSKSPADKVLEINAGLTQKLNIKIGDQITIKNDIINK